MEFSRRCRSRKNTRRAASAIQGTKLHSCIIACSQILIMNRPLPITFLMHSDDIPYIIPPLYIHASPQEENVCFYGLYLLAIIYMFMHSLPAGL